MQTIRANHQVELPLAGMFKLDPNAIRIFLKTYYLVTEKYVCRFLDLFEQEPREVAATKNDEASASQLPEDTRTKPRNPLAGDYPQSAIRACDSQYD